MLEFWKVVLTILIFAVIGGLLGILIGVCSKIFHVEEDTRVEQIQALLPGANCGGCGYPGCQGMAEAIVNDGVNPKNCKPNKPEKIEAIEKLLTEFKDKKETTKN